MWSLEDIHRVYVQKGIHVINIEGVVMEVIFFGGGGACKLNGQHLAFPTNYKSSLENLTSKTVHQKLNF